MQLLSLGVEFATALVVVSCKEEVGLYIVVAPIVDVADSSPSSTSIIQPVFAIIDPPR
jgi:hypothetical protein